ncbi:MAG TPA: hypothetical protein VNT01_13615 [Symbiobacteriaceae bacterium]|nr:hypothetical protein [Symbiobacteriaceae bacterium]
MNKVLGHIGAAVAGVLPAFFLVFQSVFTDSSSAGERTVALGLIALVYGLLGALFGYFTRSWQSGLWLGVPAVMLVGLYSVREPQQLLLHVATVAVALLAGWAGARLTAGAGRRR